MWVRISNALVNLSNVAAFSVEGEDMDEKLLVAFSGGGSMTFEDGLIYDFSASLERFEKTLLNTPSGAKIINFPLVEREVAF